jgi:enoyl-[acyl-carrier protein] reductase I
MGVANHRSIAWACVESFRKIGYNVVVTYQNYKLKRSIDKLIGEDDNIQAVSCNVETEIPLLFQQRLPELNISSLDAIVHSIAYAPFGDDPSRLKLSEASLQDFQTAQHISAYSLLETAQYGQPLLQPSTNPSITALTYLGAVRALSQYYLMGPAKASLEACVRGLALELGHQSGSKIRVNAVSAGPLRTLSSRGIPQFTELWQHVHETAPLKRPVTALEVADTVRFLATEGTGITGQVVYVDGGYSSVIPVG